MEKKKQPIDPTSTLADNVRFLLILQLFKLGVPQGDIAKKLHMSIVVVNSFLKGIKLK